MKKENNKSKKQPNVEKKTDAKCTCNFAHHQHSPSCPCYKEYIM